MLILHWGLGAILYSQTKNNDFIFGHDGGNDPAINSTARINPKNEDAIIILAHTGFSGKRASQMYRIQARC